VADGNRQLPALDPLAYYGIRHRPFARFPAYVKTTWGQGKDIAGLVDEMRLDSYHPHDFEEIWTVGPIRDDRYYDVEWVRLHTTRRGWEGGPPDIKNIERWRRTICGAHLRPFLQWGMEGIYAMQASPGQVGSFVDSVGPFACDICRFGCVRRRYELGVRLWIGRQM